MRTGLAAAATVAATLALTACGSDAGERRGTFEEKRPPAAQDDSASRPAPPKPLSADAEAPTGEKDKDKEKGKEPPRGNTPPGTDRSGGGPASGAIVDPSGAATK